MSQQLPPNVPFRERLASVTEKAAQIGERLDDAAAIGYHGLAGAIAHRRMERAGTIMERMDHKTALYQDLGSLALGEHQTATETTHKGELISGRVVGSIHFPDFYDFEPAAPRSFIERHIDKKWDKKSINYASALTQRAKVANIFGKEPEDPYFSKPKTFQEAIDRGITISLGSPSGTYPKKANNKTIETSIGARPRSLGEFGSQVVDLSLGSHIPGFNKRQKTLMRLGLRGKGKLNNALGKLKLDVPKMRELQLENVHRTNPRNLTAREKRSAKANIAELPIKLGANMHRNAHRKKLVSGASLKVSTAQPISSRWRKMRQKHAINRIKKNYYRTKEHATKKDFIISK